MFTAAATTASTVADPAFASFTIDQRGLHLVGTASVTVAMPVVR